MKLQTKQMNAADLWELLDKGVPHFARCADIPQEVDHMYVELLEFCVPAWGEGFCVVRMKPVLAVSDYSKEHDFVTYNATEGPINYKIYVRPTVHKE